MKELLYYPGFEIKDEQWLKFALLYLDHISPIIPFMEAPEETYLSRKFLQVKNGSDLIRIKEPGYRDTCYASNMAIEQMESHLNRMYYSRSTDVYQTADHLQYWRRPENHNYLLYRGKYDWKFVQYCRDNGFATEAERGILLSRDVAEYYMSCLAEVISERENLEMMTDSTVQEEMLLYNVERQKGGTFEHVKIARKELELAVPLQLKEIPLEKILELRKDPKFEQQRKAYINALDHVIKMRNEGRSDYSMEQELNLQKEYCRMLCKLLDISGRVMKGVLSICNVALPLGMQGVSEMLRTPENIRSIVKDAYDIGEKKKRTDEKKLASRYTVSLERLSRAGAANLKL